MCSGSIGRAVTFQAPEKKRNQQSGFGGTPLSSSATAPKPLTPEDVEKTKERGSAEEAKRAALRAGKGSTILTSPLGLTAPANVRRKTLLGS